MPRRRLSTTSESLQPASAEPATRPTASRATGLAVVGFLLGSAAYFTLFLHNEVVPGVRAYERLTFLLLPDELWADWCGGEAGQVAVLDRAGPVAVALLMVAVAGLLGWLLLDALRLVSQFGRLEAAVLACGLGLSGLSLFTLAVGLLGGLQQSIWFVLLGLAAVLACLWRIWRHGSLPIAVRDAMPRHTRAGDPLARTVVRPDESQPAGAGRWPRWWWATLPFAAVICAGAVLPPLDFDVLEYHLQVPKEWYLQGRVTFLPHNVYGNMPLGGEILAAQAMALMPGTLSWWWGALAGKLVLAAFTLLTTALVYVAGRRYFSQRAGIVAALVYISTAWLALVSQNGLNEGVVAYYLFASFHVARIWWEKRHEHEGHARGLLVVTGLLAGSAVACKYTSLLLVACPLTVFVAWSSRPRCVRGVLWLLLGAAAASGPWFAKNWVLTGNPTYPLLYRVFGGETRTPEKDAQWRRAHQVPRDAAGRRYSLSQAGQAALEVLGGSGWQNPLIVPLSALLLLCRGRRQVLLYWLAMLVFVLVAWWLATHRLTRFWVPAIPVMALLAGAGAAWSEALVWRRVLAFVLGGGLLANFVFVVAPYPRLADSRYCVSLEQLRDDPRMAFPPGARQGVALRYLNDHVSEGCVVLVVGNAAVFHARVPVVYNTCFDDCAFEALFRDRTAQQRRERLDELRISHVYVDWAELRRYRQPGNYGYSSYVTPEIVHDELVARQQLLRLVNVEGLEPDWGEIFEVTSSRPYPGE